MFKAPSFHKEELPCMGNILQELWQAKPFCGVLQESKKLSVDYKSEDEEYEYVAEIEVK